MPAEEPAGVSSSVFCRQPRAVEPAIQVLRLAAERQNALELVVAVSVPIAITVTGGRAGNVPQRAMIVGEVGGVQHLQARVVLAIEWRLGRRATRLLCRCEGIKPQ